MADKDFHLECADRFEVQDLGEKGLGLVASRPMAKGELVLQD